MSSRLLTHQLHPNIAFDSLSLTKNLESQSHLSLPLDDMIALLDQLSQFELGRFLLLNKGLNGYWTSYILLHGVRKRDLHPLEKWLLHRAPSIKATQERFKICQSILQNTLKDDSTLASIPCGLMEDVLTLNYKHTKNVHLTGIDLDPQSLDLAQEKAKQLHFSQVSFLQEDAWALNIHETFDTITSNGLNIYEHDEDRVIDLYRQFYKALKPEGRLIISFLTPPPSVSKTSPWRHVSSEDALKQKAIFSDILGVAWQAFRTEGQTRKYLETAGFQILDIIYDSQGIFPTVVARKPCI